MRANRAVDARRPADAEIFNFGGAFAEFESGVDDRAAAGANRARKKRRLPNSILQPHRQRPVPGLPFPRANHRVRAGVPWKSVVDLVRQPSSPAIYRHQRVVPAMFSAITPPTIASVPITLSGVNDSRKYTAPIPAMSATPAPQQIG